MPHQIKLELPLFIITEKLEREESHVTAEKIRNAFLGVTVKKQMLLEVLKQHNDEMSKLVGIGKSKDTLQKYQRTYRCFESFMRHQYTIDDIAKGNQLQLYYWV